MVVAARPHACVGPDRRAGHLRAGAPSGQPPGHLGLPESAPVSLWIDTAAVIVRLLRVATVLHLSVLTAASLAYREARPGGGRLWSVQRRSGVLGVGCDRHDRRRLHRARFLRGVLALVWWVLTCSRFALKRSPLVVSSPA